MAYINREKYNINWNNTILEFQDKTTKQFVIYIPSLDISGYGSTEKKAMKMLRFSLEELKKAV